MSDIFKGKMKMDESFDYSHIINENYLLLGLHKQEIFNSYGDMIELNLYREYDEVNEIFSKIAVKEARTYTRNSQTGLPKKRLTDITWYDVDGNVIATKLQQTKYYNAKKGFTANKRARQNIIAKASMYLFSALLGVDPATAEANVDNFESLTDLAASKYIKSNTQPLLDIITNSTDNTKPEYRAYITVGMRDTLLNILNIQYT